MKPPKKFGAAIIGGAFLLSGAVMLDCVKEAPATAWVLIFIGVFTAIMGTIMNDGI